MNNNIYKNGEGYKDPTAGKAISNINKGGYGMSEIKRGDIYCRQKKNGEDEYFIIISRSDRCEKGSNVLVAKITDERPNLLPSQTNVVCRGLMTVNCDIIYFVYRNETGDLVRTATEDEMRNVDKCLAESLGISTSNNAKINRLLEDNERLRNEIQELKEREEFKGDEFEPVMETEADYEEFENHIRVLVERDFYKEQYENMLARLIGGGACA